MCKKIFAFLFSLTFAATVFGQEKPIKFTVEVSTDSILMDNYFEVKFTLDNASGQNFEAPDFSSDFNVVSGPNFSTSMSIMNGEATQSMTITYYLEPKEVGAYYIEPASVEASGEILETAPLEVMVVPNPEGIKQSPPRRNDSFHFDFGSPFDMGKDFPGFDMEMPFFDLKTWPEMPVPPQPSPGQKAAPKKKKRKTIRI